MTQTERYFIQLLAAFVQEKPTPAPENIDWQELRNTAIKQSVGGIMYYMLKNLPDTHIVPEDIYQQLSDHFNQTIARAMIRDYEMAAIFDILNDEKIVHVPIKGLVTCRYYPVPELRTMGDVDFVVHQEDQPRVRSVLTVRGYRCLADQDHCWSYESPDTGLHIEVNHALLYLNYGQDVREDLPDFWDHVSPDASAAYTGRLDKAFQMALHIAHMVRHLAGEGCGIRFAMDTAVLARQDGLDREEAAKILSSYGLSSFFSFMLDYCHTVFETEIVLPGTISTDPLLLDKLNSDFLGNGTFGRETLDTLVRNDLVRRQKAGQKKYRFVLFYLMKKAFPSLRYMQERYLYLKKRPWLLPTAYLQRGWKALTSKNTRSFIRFSVKRARKVFHGIDQVQEHVHLYQDIGIYRTQTEQKNRNSEKLQ